MPYPAESSGYVFRESISQADMLACQFDAAREPKQNASVAKTQMKIERSETFHHL